VTKVSENWLAIYRAPDPFPPRVNRLLTYLQQVTLSSAAVAFQYGAENVWRLNDIFDPDLTGGAHQPYGMDQMAALYGRYKVKAITIDFTAIPPAAQTSLAIGLSVQPNNATATLVGNSVTGIGEQPNSHTMYLMSTGMPSKVRQRFLIHEVEGLTSSQLDANVQDYGALTTASPGRQPLLRVALANMASTTVVAIACMCRLEYEVEFYDRNILATSF
jgi:hypothetical protein